MTRRADYVCPSCGRLLSNAHVTRTHLMEKHAVVIWNVEPWRRDAPAMSYEVWAEAPAETAMEAAFRRAAA